MYSFCSTPGTGKTTHAAQVVEQLQSNPSTSGASWQHVNVGDFVKDKGCHSGYNEEWQSWDVDEDKVCSSLIFLFPVTPWTLTAILHACVAAG
jgi:broad-specificity NMP kinase